MKKVSLLAITTLAVLTLATADVSANPSYQGMQWQNNAPYSSTPYCNWGGYGGPQGYGSNGGYGWGCW